MVCRGIVQDSRRNEMGDWSPFVTIVVCPDISPRNLSGGGKHSYCTSTEAIKIDILTVSDYSVHDTICDYTKATTDTLVDMQVQ